LGEVFSAERDQLGGDLRSGVKARHELDDGLDFLAEVFVRDAEDGAPATWGWVMRRFSHSWG
jgi:hypothetical protein